MNDATQADIIHQLTKLISEIAPDATPREKYGGIVMEKVAGEPSTQCCGVFGYAQHVSLEFSKGAEFQDPTGILEGAGKYRRHIKLKTASDVQSLNCRRFLEQAFHL